VTVGGLALALVLVLLAARPRTAPPVVIADPGTVSAPRAVNVIMRDYLFQPDPLVLVRGETVRFTIVNGGLEPHQFVLGDDEDQRAWASAQAAATPPAPFATAPSASVDPSIGAPAVVLASGASTTFDVVVAATGTLAVVCHLPGHVARGMVASVELRDA
jgi:uncharacterized cupredoxin-like copper-binding protein